MDAGKVSVYEYSCKIVRVVDGDTVDVDIDLGFGVWMHKERIRLHGIDTPESRTRDLEEKKFGLLAKKQVEHFLPEGSIQTLITVKDKAGKFGRILGKFKIEEQRSKIIADDQFNFTATTTINEWMIRHHHAAPYFGQSKDEIAQTHLANRSMAQDVWPEKYNEWRDRNDNSNG